MDIEFKGLDESVQISDYAIREVTESYHNESVPIKQKHFQALVSGSSISKNSIINCLIKYYGEDNHFLGLDKQDIWVQEKQPIAVSMRVTIPDDAVRSEIQLEVGQNFSIYLGWLWGTGILFLIVLGIIGLVGLFD